MPGSFVCNEYCYGAERKKREGSLFNKYPRNAVRSKKQYLPYSHSGEEPVEGFRDALPSPSGQEAKCGGDQYQFSSSSVSKVVALGSQAVLNS